MSRRVAVVDELRAERQHRPGRAEQLGLQHLVHVQRRLAVLLRQAMVAMPAAEDQVSGAVDQHARNRPCRRAASRAFMRISRWTIRVRRLGERARPTVAQEVVQGVVDRAASSCVGPGQAVEVGQDLRCRRSRYWKSSWRRLPSLQQVQEQAPPEQEALVVDRRGPGSAGRGARRARR